MKDRIVILVATGLYSGFAPKWSGTFGSIPAWLIAFFFMPGNLTALAVASVVGIFLSVWAAGEAERFFGHDAKKIVIDEWAGMFITLLFVPFSLTNYLIAFFAFRFFDVAKIPPASQAERLPGGWGVTADDVVAGIQANLATHFVIFAWQRWM
jgi:phosphatidylglycerophosphatase A